MIYHRRMQRRVMSSPPERGAFTLIELVAALLSATVILVALASTISVTQQLLQQASETSSADDARFRHRLASDLRYATGVDRQNDDQFSISRLNPTNGLAELITYEISDAGVTRQLNSEKPLVLYQERPATQFHSITTTETSQSEALTYARVRGSSRSKTYSQAPSLTLSVPPGCCEGDLVLIAIAGRAQEAPQITLSGWTVFQDARFSGTSLLCAYRTDEASLERDIQIAVTPKASISAIAVAVENSDTSAPIAWTSVANNVASPPNLNTPIELAAPNQLPGRLNLQIVAGHGMPWQWVPFGMSGYADIQQSVASETYPESAVSLVIAARSASELYAESPPSSLYGVTSEWIQVGCQLEVKQ